MASSRLVCPRPGCGSARHLYAYRAVRIRGRVYRRHRCQVCQWVWVSKQENLVGEAAEDALEELGG